MKWLEGKKTYLAALGLAGLAVAGFWFHFLARPETAALIFMALGLVGIGHKIDRQVEMFLDLLEKERDKHEGQPTLRSAQDVAPVSELKYEPIDKTGELDR